MVRAFPLSVVRVNPSAFELVKRCDGQTPLREAAAGLDHHTARDLLDHLVRRGFMRLSLSPSGDLPAVSVVVPVRNRPRQVKECIESLLALDYPADKLEIIVVDDGSEDETPEVLASLPINAIRSPSHIRAAASRNLGWRAARGDVIAFTDSDCRVDPAWLAELVGRFQDPEVAAVGGLVAPGGARSTLARYEAARSPLYSGPQEKEVGGESPISYLPTCNLLIRKRVLEEVGGFDSAFHPVGEDVDLVWRVLQAGHRVIYSPMGAVSHHHRATFVPFLKRRYEYAASESQLLGKHPEKRRVAILPIPQVAVTLLLGVWALSGWPIAAVVAAVLLVLQAAVMRLRLGAATRLVGWGGIGLSLGRGYLGFGQLLLWTLSQYYVIPLLALAAPAVALGVVSLPVAIGVAALLLAAGALLSYLTDRPAMNPVTFMAMFGLDKLAFQVGSLRGCLKQRSAKSLFPRLRVIW